MLTLMPLTVDIDPIIKQVESLKFEKRLLLNYTEGKLLNGPYKTKPELATFFKKYNSQKIYILLDTIDQTYKKKTYPSVRKTDLEKIIRRDLAGDGDKEALKSYIKIGRAHV